MKDLKITLLFSTLVGCYNCSYKEYSKEMKLTGGIPLNKGYNSNFTEKGNEHNTKLISYAVEKKLLIPTFDDHGNYSVDNNIVSLLCTALKVLYCESFNNRSELLRFFPERDDQKLLFEIILGSINYLFDVNNHEPIYNALYRLKNKSESRDKKEIARDQEIIFDLMKKNFINFFKKSDARYSELWEDWHSKKLSSELLNTTSRSNENYEICLLEDSFKEKEEELTELNSVRYNLNFGAFKNPVKSDEHFYGYINHLEIARMSEEKIKVSEPHKFDSFSDIHSEEIDREIQKRLLNLNDKAFLPEKNIESAHNDSDEFYYRNKEENHSKYKNSKLSKISEHNEEEASFSYKATESMAGSSVLSKESGCSRKSGKIIKQVIHCTLPFIEKKQPFFSSNESSICHYNQTSQKIDIGDMNLFSSEEISTNKIINVEKELSDSINYESSEDHLSEANSSIAKKSYHESKKYPIANTSLWEELYGNDEKSRRPFCKPSELSKKSNKYRDLLHFTTPAKNLEKQTEPTSIINYPEDLVSQESNQKNSNKRDEKSKSRSNLKLRRTNSKHVPPKSSAKEECYACDHHPLKKDNESITRQGPIISYWKP